MKRGRMAELENVNVRFHHRSNGKSKFAPTLY